MFTNIPTQKWYIYFEKNILSFFTNILWCFVNILMTIKIYQDVYKYTKHFLNVPDVCQMYQGVYKYIHQFTNIWLNFQNIPWIFFHTSSNQHTSNKINFLFFLLRLVLVLVIMFQHHHLTKIYYQHWKKLLPNYRLKISF